MSTKSSFANEHVLIAHLKRGSERAYDQIYQHYARRLLAYCFDFTKNMDDAEEITQDVFVQLWRYREQIKQEESLQSFLFTTARNRLINAYRSRVNSVLYEDYLDYQDELMNEHAKPEIEYQEFADSVEQALASLPKTQRRAIELSRFEELSIKDIALELSLSEQTIKNQISLGIKALRRLIAPGSVYSLVYYFFVNMGLFAPFVCLIYISLHLMTK